MNINILADDAPTTLTITFESKEYVVEVDKVFLCLLRARQPRGKDKDELEPDTILERFGDQLTNCLKLPRLPISALITISDTAAAHMEDHKKKSLASTPSHS